MPRGAPRNAPDHRDFGLKEFAPCASTVGKCYLWCNLWLTSLGALYLFICEGREVRLYPFLVPRRLPAVTRLQAGHEERGDGYIWEPLRLRYCRLAWSCDTSHLYDSSGAKSHTWDAVTPGLTLGTLYSSGVGTNKTKQHKTVLLPASFLELETFVIALITQRVPTRNPHVTQRPVTPAACFVPLPTREGRCTFPPIAQGQIDPHTLPQPRPRAQPQRDMSPASMRSVSAIRLLTRASASSVTCVGGWTGGMKRRR